MNPAELLASLEAEMSKLQRDMAPKYATMNYNEVCDFVTRFVTPLRKRISAARATVTREARKNGAP